MQFIKNLNQNHFSVIFCILSIVLIYFTLGSALPALTILGAGLQQISTWLLTQTAFIFFLNGIGCDVYKEIFQEHNGALGIMLGFYSVALALLIVL